MTDSQRQRVCVIGAGIAGLVTAKVMVKDGFDVVVYEKESALGGTWAAARSYPGLRTNNCKYTYCFSDFPYPKSVDVYPLGDDVRAYLESYTDHFQIRELIHCNHSVSNVVAVDGDPVQYEVTVTNTDDDSPAQTLTFDFVVICNGVFHAPFIPQYEGMDKFGGRVIPSCDATDEIYQNSKHPIVVGGGKSALDSATAAAKRGLSPTLVLRHPHWIAPRFLPGGIIPGDFVIISRMVSALLPYHRASATDRFLHGIGKPITDAFWATLSFVFPRAVGMPPYMRPNPLPDDLERIGVGGEFFVELNAGRATAKIGSIKRFSKDFVELEDGQKLIADLVIFATGWEQNLDLLSEALARDIKRDNRFHVYRHILPPRARGIGFIGYASSVTAQLTAEVGAHWLAQSFHGAINLPTTEEMDREIEKVHDWAAETMPSRSAGFFIGASVPHYIDDLLSDMGVPLQRRPDFIRENFFPLFPSRYASLGDERRMIREGQTIKRGFYLSAWTGLVLVAVIMLFIL